ncbi:unnamed protein product, partial [Musa acuminata subsp. burmannicoides]
MVYCFYSYHALSCRSTDSESKPEWRQARKQRKMEAIQARLIVPLPPAVTSLEQTVSGMSREVWRSVRILAVMVSTEEIANENRGSGEVLVSNTGESSERCFDMNGLSGSLEVTRTQLMDFDLPLSGLTENVGRVCEEKHSELREVRSEENIKKR